MSATHDNSMGTSQTSWQGFPLSRWGLYFVKALVILALLFAFSRTAPIMPSVLVAAIWALFSLFSAVGITYHVVMRKNHRQMILEAGGRLSWLNKGRIITLLVSFAASAVCIAGFIFEAPKWGVGEWVLIVLAVPLFFVVYMLVERLLTREYNPLFRQSKTVVWSCSIVGAILVAGYLAMLAAQPQVTCGSAAEAFAMAQKPFDASPSALLHEIGIVTAYVDGITAYGVSKVAEISYGGYLVWRIVLYASAFFGVVNLIGLCSLEWGELRKVFSTLDENPGDAPDAASEFGAAAPGVASEPGPASAPIAASEPGPASAPIAAPSSSRVFLKRYAIWAGVLPVLLVAGFLTLDAQVAKATGTEELTAAEQFVKSQADLFVFVVDGHYYEQQAVQDAVAQAREQSLQLSAEAREALVPLINESFDKRIENVDSYLDWYYSLPADYERLARMVTGSVDDFVADEFASRIEAGVDDSQLMAEFDRYFEQAATLEEDLLEALSEYEVTDVPEWLLDTRDSLTIDSLSEPLKPTQDIVDAGERMGLSVGAGIVGGAVTKILMSRMMGKQFFKKMVARIATALGERGAGAVVGGAVGSLGGPVGTLAGVVAGTAITVGVDYGMLKFDEAQNRETYKAEIVEAIEEERAAMLAAVQGA